MVFFVGRALDLWTKGRPTKNTISFPTVFESTLVIIVTQNYSWLSSLCWGWVGGRGGGSLSHYQYFHLAEKKKKKQRSSSGTVKRQKRAWFGHDTPRRALQSHSSGHLGGWPTPWSEKEMLDGQHKEWAFLPMLELLNRASCRERLGEDLCWIICHNYLPDKPVGQGTELNWINWYTKQIT